MAFGFKANNTILIELNVSKFFVFKEKWLSSKHIGFTIKVYEIDILA